jgi:UDP-N-acetylmuramoyl-L-alanyl-D-glutamate--2,6-diaminopimelate ligase
MDLSSLLITSGQFPEIDQKIPAQEITGICFDSRKVEPGCLFIALEGGSVDGHKFISNAIHSGAGAIVGRIPLEIKEVPYYRTENPRRAMAHIAAAFYGFPTRSLKVIGVTGTDGKTTTVNLIYRILLACGIKAGMISTVNAVIGDEIIDTGFHVTTPESTVIQSLLKKMVDAGITHVVLETTSHGLDQYRAEACEFDMGVITNITHEHLDYHGSYNEYFSAKFRLIEYLVSSEKSHEGFSPTTVINSEDISYPKILERIDHPEFQQLQTIVYGLSNAVDVVAENIYVDIAGLRFDVRIPTGQGSVSSPLIGEYNIQNILAAIGATAVGLKLPLDKVLEGIRAMDYVPGRMERIDMGQDFSAIVDFAHTPNALKVALETSRKLTQGRVIAVFGSAGLRDRQKRRMMAAVSTQLADISIMTAEDPRTEQLEDILTEMADEARKSGSVEGKDFHIIPDRGAAIMMALRLAQPGDLVIACGKGHEQSMCFGEIEYPWDDRTAMRAALSKLLEISGPEMPTLPTSMD